VGPSLSLIWWSISIKHNYWSHKSLWKIKWATVADFGFSWSFIYLSRCTCVLQLWLVLIACLTRLTVESPYITVGAQVPWICWTRYCYATVCNSFCVFASLKLNKRKHFFLFSQGPFWKFNLLWASSFHLTTSFFEKWRPFLTPTWIPEKPWGFSETSSVLLYSY